MKNARTTWLVTATCLIAGTLGMARSWAAEIPDSEQVSKLLADVRGEALLLRDDAQLMESYTRSDISHETQARTVTDVKAHVNAMGKEAGGTGICEKYRISMAGRRDRADSAVPA